MLGIGLAHVHVAVVLWDEVHIMEEETIPVLLPHGLPEAHIHQLGPVERVVSSLRKHTMLQKEIIYLGLCKQLLHRLQSVSIILINNSSTQDVSKY